MDKILIAFAMKYKGNYQLVFEAIECKEKLDSKEIENLLSSVTWSYLTIMDARYPVFFKKHYNPPIVLFYEGNLTLLNEDLTVIEIEGHRAFFNIAIHDGKVDYVIASEYHDDMAPLVEKLIKCHPEINFHTYTS